MFCNDKIEGESPQWPPDTVGTLRPHGSTMACFVSTWKCCESYEALITDCSSPPEFASSLHLLLWLRPEPIVSADHIKRFYFESVSLKLSRTLRCEQVHRNPPLSTKPWRNKQQQTSFWARLRCERWRELYSLCSSAARRHLAGLLLFQSDSDGLRGCLAGDVVFNVSGSLCCLKK